MVDSSWCGSFLYKFPKEVWKLFENLTENSHLHAPSSHFDLPRQLGSKREIYEVSHSIDLFSKVDPLAEKFDQLFYMNKVSNSPPMWGVFDLYKSHAYFCPCIGKSNCVTIQVNAT